MDTLGLAATVISLGIFAVVLYESIAVAAVIGKIPRFWFLFLAAISFLIARRILVLFAGNLLPLPGYWAAIDSDGTPIIFSALLLLFVYDMRKTFQRGVPRNQAQLSSTEKA